MRRYLTFFSIVILMVILNPGIKVKAATQGYEKIEVNYDESTSSSRTNIAGVYFWYDKDEAGNYIIRESSSETKNNGIALTDLTFDGVWEGLVDAWTNGKYIYYTKGTRISSSEGTVTLYKMAISTQKAQTIGSFSAKVHTDSTGGYYGILGIYVSKIYIGLNLNKIYVIDTKNVTNKKIVPTKFLSKIDLLNNDLAENWDGWNGSGYVSYSNAPSGPQSLYNGRYLVYSSDNKLYAYDLKIGTEKKLASSCYGWKIYETTAKYAYIRLWHYIVDEDIVNESDKFYKLTQSNLKMIAILSQDFCYNAENEQEGLFKYTADEIVYYDMNKETYYRLNADGTKDELTLQDIYDNYW
ncbi:MAG: hypothetical protein PHF63_04315 [Herbinix sp.]|nr:hypothetical protein [Herbinix sp.]